MEYIFPILLIGGVVSLFGWITYLQLRTFYDRYLRGYHDEIREFLISHSLQVVEIRYPTKSDWLDNCFPEPHAVKFGFTMVQMSYLFNMWSMQEHKIIEAVDENDRKYRIWLEIETEMFQKPKLTFKKKEVKSFYAPDENMDSDNLAPVTNKCPACGWKLEGTETQCPECELHFQ